MGTDHIHSPGWPGLPVLSALSPRPRSAAIFATMAASSAILSRGRLSYMWRTRPRVRPARPEVALRALARRAWRAASSAGPRSHSDRRRASRDLIQHQPFVRNAINLPAHVSLILASPVVKRQLCPVGVFSVQSPRALALKGRDTVARGAAPGTERKYHFSPVRASQVCVAKRSAAPSGLSDSLKGPAYQGLRPWLQCHALSAPQKTQGVQCSITLDAVGVGG